jgi:hypothetical protein
MSEPIPRPIVTSGNDGTFVELHTFVWPPLDADGERPRVLALRACLYPPQAAYENIPPDLLENLRKIDDPQFLEVCCDLVEIEILPDLANACPNVIGPG